MHIGSRVVAESNHLISMDYDDGPIEMYMSENEISGLMNMGLKKTLQSSENNAKNGNYNNMTLGEKDMNQWYII